MRALPLLLALCLPLCAQFMELASTDDGRHLYFASTLTLSDAPPASGQPNILFYAGNRA